MPKPFKISPLINVPAYIKVGAEGENTDADTQALVPAEVTAAWDYYKATLGQTVPAHINRARDLAGSFTKLVA